jgi:hypothetical protein
MVDGFSDAVPNVNSCPLSKLPGNVAMWMSIKHDDPNGLPPRALITNLSMRPSRKSLLAERPARPPMGLRL